MYFSPSHQYVLQVEAQFELTMLGFPLRGGLNSKLVWASDELSWISAKVSLEVNIILCRRTEDFVPHLRHWKDVRRGSLNGRYEQEERVYIVLRQILDVCGLCKHFWFILTCLINSFLCLSAPIITFWPDVGVWHSVSHRLAQARAAAINKVEQGVVSLPWGDTLLVFSLSNPLYVSSCRPRTR